MLKTNAIIQRMESYKTQMIRNIYNTLERMILHSSNTGLLPFGMRIPSVKPNTTYPLNLGLSEIGVFPQTLTVPESILPVDTTRMWFLSGVTDNTNNGGVDTVWWHQIRFELLCDTFWMINGIYDPLITGETVGAHFGPPSCVLGSTKGSEACSGCRVRIIAHKCKTENWEQASLNETIFTNASSYRLNVEESKLYNREWAEIWLVHDMESLNGTTLYDGFGCAEVELYEEEEEEEEEAEDSEMATDALRWQPTNISHISQTTAYAYTL